MKKKPSPKTKPRPREDVNQIAARILRSTAKTTPPEPPPPSRA